MQCLWNLETFSDKTSNPTGISRSSLPTLHNEDFQVNIYIVNALFHHVSVGYKSKCVRKGVFENPETNGFLQFTPFVNDLFSPKHDIR